MYEFGELEVMNSVINSRQGGQIPILSPAHLKSSSPQNNNDSPLPSPLRIGSNVSSYCFIVFCF